VDIAKLNSTLTINVQWWVLSVVGLLLLGGFFLTKALATTYLDQLTVQVSKHATLSTDFQSAYKDIVDVRNQTKIELMSSINEIKVDVASIKSGSGATEIILEDIRDRISRLEDKVDAIR